MRVILDTNILLSALIVSGGSPEFLYQCWRRGRFTLISSEDQVEEFRRVTRYSRLQRFIRPANAGTMLNQIVALAEFTGPLPRVDACIDPGDNFLLAMASTGNADYLVTGDGQHLLTIQKHGRTRILTAREAAAMLL